MGFVCKIGVGMSTIFTYKKGHCYSETHRLISCCSGKHTSEMHRYWVTWEGIKYVVNKGFSFPSRTVNIFSIKGFQISRLPLELLFGWCPRTREDGWGVPWPPSSLCGWKGWELSGQSGVHSSFDGSEISHVCIWLPVKHASGPWSSQGIHLERRKKQASG